MNLEQSAFVPLTIALVEFAKRVGMPSRFAPFLAIVLGIGLTLSDGIFYVEKLIQGIMVGLASCGLYSGTKSIIGK